MLAGLPTDSGWNLDVTSETNYNRALKEAYNSLLNIEGVGEKTALNLYQSGFRSAEDISESHISDLLPIEGLGEEKARKIIENAIQVVSSKEAEEETGGNGESEKALEEAPAEEDE